MHARGGDGQLPLHFAATVEIAALLLDHGADINARDIDHESTAAQYMACSRQYLEWREPYRHDVARFLISRGAQTDILMASAIGDLALVERILNHDPERFAPPSVNATSPSMIRSRGSIYIFGFGSTKFPHMVAHRFEHPEVFALSSAHPNWLRLINAAEVGEEATSSASLPTIRSYFRSFQATPLVALSAWRCATTPAPSVGSSRQVGHPTLYWRTAKSASTSLPGTAM